MSLSVRSPRIGFDRFIALDWVATAMRVRAGLEDKKRLLSQLESAELTPSAIKKTLTLLNRQWLAPRADMAAFCDRGAAAWTKAQQTHPESVAWGVTVVAYPFFAKVAEVIGRLTAIQGDCRSSDVHRRIAEVYGQRDAIRRATNAVLQTQAEWGLIDRQARGQRIVRRDPVCLTDERMSGWLVEAGLRHAGKALPAASVASQSVLFPFVLAQPLAMLLPYAPELELRCQGAGEQFICVRDRVLPVQIQHVAAPKFISGVP